jgi:hypothetical protein
MIFYFILKAYSLDRRLEGRIYRRFCFLGFCVELTPPCIIFQEIEKPRYNSVDIINP